MKLKRAPVLRFCCILAALCTSVVMLSGCFPVFSCYVQSSEDWARQTIEKHYYRFDGDYSSLSDLEGLTIPEMVAKLDIYSAYYTYQEYNAVLSDAAGSKSGVGVSFSYIAGEGIVLYSVVGNSPAKKAGLKAGDVILSATAGDETVQFNKSDDFSSFITARATGEEFTLRLKGGAEFTLAKEEYTASYASMYTSDCVYEIEYEGGARDVKRYDGGIPQLPEGTAYIYLSQFYGNAADEMGELFKVFKQEGCTSLILDLRDDGGGYVNVMAQIGGRFTSEIDSKAVAMKAVYKDGFEELTYCENYSTGVLPKGTPVYVMANNNTASAAEALIGVLVSYNILDYENIFLSEYSGMQAKSYGKGIMQSAFSHRITGEVLKLTVAGIYWQNDKTIHDKGLTVEDGCVAAPASDNIVNVGYDDELEPVIAKIIADRAAQN